MDQTRASEIVRGKKGLVPVDTALRLSRFFGTTPDFWMNMHTQYDKEVKEAELAEELRKIRPIRP